MLCLDGGGAIIKIKARRGAGGRGGEDGMMHSALSVLKCQQDLQLRMPSPLGRRFTSLNHPFRGNRGEYRSEYNCKRKIYSEEREEDLCLILFLSKMKRKEEAL